MGAGSGQGAWLCSWGIAPVLGGGEGNSTEIVKGRGHRWAALRREGAVLGCGLGDTVAACPELTSLPTGGPDSESERLWTVTWHWGLGPNKHQ